MSFSLFHANLQNSTSSDFDSVLKQSLRDVLSVQGELATMRKYHRGLEIARVTITVDIKKNSDETIICNSLEHF